MTPNESSKPKPNNFYITIAMLGQRVLIIVNFSPVQVDLKGWQILDVYGTSVGESFRFGLEECNGIVPSVLNPGESIRLTFDYSDKPTSDSCKIEPKRGSGERVL